MEYMKAYRVEVEKILADALEKMLDHVKREYYVPSSAVASTFEMLASWKKAIDEYHGSIGMFEGVYAAAENYNEIRSIGLEHAFSSVIAELGIRVESVDWHKVMGYYHLKQAERIENGEYND